jgi:hypothetical protein
MKRTPDRKRHSMVGLSLSLCALLTAVSLALAAGASYGRATVGAFQFEQPISETVTNFPCSDGDPVSMTGTLTADGRFTEIDSRHFSVHATTTLDYRAELGDGRYALGRVTEHFSLSLNPRRPRTVDTSAQQEQATLYTANGQPIGTITVHVIFHFTYSDENGNLEPDPGEITASVGRVRASCP